VRRIRLTFYPQIVERLPNRRKVDHVWAQVRRTDKVNSRCIEMSKFITLIRLSGEYDSRERVMKSLMLHLLRAQSHLWRVCLTSIPWYLQALDQGLLHVAVLVLPKLLKLLSSAFPPGAVWRAAGPDGSPLRKNHVVRAAVYAVAATLGFGVSRSA
jgi:hypothetical protein